MLKIENLHATVAGKEILRGLTPEREAGRSARHHGPQRRRQVHARQRARRPRGLRGHATARCSFEGKDLLALEPEERAAEGVFLAFQYPVEIPGVNNTYFLRAALNAQRRHRGEAELDSMQFLKRVREKMAVLHMTDELLHRAVNEGFSGGEKKRNEIFQMARAGAEAGDP